MKKYFITLIALFILGGAFAQELSNFMGREPIISPEIGEKNVTFRFLAPYADTVKISGGFTPTVKMETSFGSMDVPSNLDLKKDEKGLWSITLPLPEPELYTYSFIVDGVNVNDPNNIFMQRDGTRYLSVLLIPGKVTENYYEANQRGNLNQVWYESPTLGMTRRLFVYTPYGYADSKEKYPVLYLLHGAGGDEDAWSTMGRACQILDNLIEKGLAKPMICVMPNGNPTQYAARTLMIDEKPFDRNNPAMGMMGNLYPKSIVEDIVPFIEKTYRVDARPKSRAIAGLSMGGGHTITTTLMYPGFFDYICPLSMGIGMRFGNNQDNQEEVMKTYETQFKALKKEGYKLYFLACGDTDFLFDSAKTLDKMLTDTGNKHTFYVTPGGHTWSNWRIYLNNFAPLLFK
ncbi:MAG TPA: alpha/beta hydrolase-fold protein [Draconibacterium sp.]|nr:alpha/beta hydrolase-fold protein [Draconibacterium sp.]